VKLDGTAGKSTYDQTTAVSHTGIDGAVGTKTVNVTSDIQAIVTNANWVATGGYLNFVLLATAGNVRINAVGSTGAGGNPPTLEIIYGVQQIAFADATSYLWNSGNLTGIDLTLGQWSLSVWSATTASAKGINEDMFSPQTTMVAGANRDALTHGKGANDEVQIVRARAGIADGNAQIILAQPPSGTVAGQPDGAKFLHTDGITHWFFQADRSRVTATDRLKIWKNGVLVAQSDWLDATKDVSDTLLQWMIGAHTGIPLPPAAQIAHWSGSMGALWFDDTVTCTVNDFIDSGGNPKYLGANGENPGTSGSPLVYFDGDAAAWSTGVNLGTGGNFTKYGTINDA